MKLIDCSTVRYPNKFAMVDDEDFELLNQWKWSASPTRAIFYAVRKKVGQSSLMHRFIIKPQDGMQVDHIDGDGLNNQKSNLRICTNWQNSCNKKKEVKRKYSSIYKGVSIRKNGTFIAQIMVNGLRKHIAMFKNEMDAARAYDKAAIRDHGEFASLNFPRSDYDTIKTAEEA